MLESPDMLILASNSPRRRALLELAGWNFVVQPAAVDERPVPGELPSAYVSRLAQEKCRAVAAVAAPDTIVVAADTAVIDQGEILGKPQDAREALEMLSRLQGRFHQVMSGVAVSYRGRWAAQVCVSEVEMRAYTRDEMLAYIASGDPFDKAGAYAVQNQEFHPVRSIRGCWPNVTGLPVCILHELFRQLAVPFPASFPGDCALVHEPPCFYYRRLLIRKS